MSKSQHVSSRTDLHVKIEDSLDHIIDIQTDLPVIIYTAKNKHFHNSLGENICYISSHKQLSILSVTGSLGS